MAQSVALAAEASRLAPLLLSLHTSEDVAFVAPRHPGTSAAIIDRLRRSRNRESLFAVATRPSPLSGGKMARPWRLSDRRFAPCLGKKAGTAVLRTAV